MPSGTLPFLHCPLTTMPIDLTHSVDLLDVAQAAALLKVSTSSVRRLQTRRKLAFIKVGGCVRFTKEDISAYIQKHRVELIG